MMPHLLLILLLAVVIRCSQAAADSNLLPYALSPTFAASNQPTFVTWRLRGTAPSQHSFLLTILHAASNATLLTHTAASPHPYAALPPLPGPRAGLLLTLSIRASPSSPWSAPISAPLFLGPGPSPADWGGAEWICTGPSATDARASLLRGEGVLPAGRGAPTAATLWVTGVGSYEVAMNGAPVGTDTNAPGWTAWQKRVLYSAWDVAGLLPGPGQAVVLAATLGNGFYNVFSPGGGRYTKLVEPPGGPRALLLLLRVEFGDGSTWQLSSTSSGGWLATDGGPIVFNHQYAGEDWNASLEVPGWEGPGWSPAASNALVAWAPAANCTASAPRGALMPQAYGGVGVAEILPAISLNGSSLPGTVLVDVGRNFAGIPRVVVSDVPPGSVVRVWPSETMEGGAIRQGSGGTPTYVQVFTKNTSGSATSVTVQPRFFTYGWRWLAVEVLTAAPPQPGPPPPPSPPFNGTLTVLNATYGGNCAPGLGGDASAAVSAWCGAGTRQYCDFTVCVCGDNTCGAGTPPCLPDPASNCAKDFAATFSCSGDGAGSPARNIRVAAEADNSVAVLSCSAAPPPPPPAQPIVAAAAGLFTRVGAAVVGTWKSSNEWVNRIHNITVEAIAANLQHVLTDCPQCVVSPPHRPSLYKYCLPLLHSSPPPLFFPSFSSVARGLAGSRCRTLWPHPLPTILIFLAYGRRFPSTLWTASWKAVWCPTLLQSTLFSLAASGTRQSGALQACSIRFGCTTFMATRTR